MEKKNETRIKAIAHRIFATAQVDMSDEIESDDRSSSVAIILVCGLIGIYFLAHQVMSTGFLTEKFGTLEMIMLYGPLVFWITTSTFILIGWKNPSRDLDSFGGLFFATFAISWNLVVFPFDFAHFADVLPEFLRFLFGWISNDVARVIMTLEIAVHLIFGVYSFILRVFVYKARALRYTKTDINKDDIPILKLIKEDV
jgi:hypothetical protein